MGRRQWYLVYFRLVLGSIKYCRTTSCRKILGAPNHVSTIPDSTICQHDPSVCYLRREERKIELFFVILVPRYF